MSHCLMIPLRDSLEGSLSLSGRVLEGTSSRIFLGFGNMISVIMEVGDVYIVNNARLDKWKGVGP